MASAALSDSFMDTTPPVADSKVTNQPVPPTSDRGLVSALVKNEDRLIAILDLDALFPG